MGYKRMKKRKWIKIEKDIKKAFKMLGFRNMGLEYLGHKVKEKNDDMWFESPNATGYLDK